MLQVEADLLKMIFKIVGGTSPFATVDNASKLVERLLIEPKCFANFSRGGTVAIGDDVRRHRSTELAVSLIHILNCFFSLVATWQIKIDVRPFAELFRQKPFEEQLHTDRIDRCDSQRIANGAVCCRPAALH